MAYIPNQNKKEDQTSPSGQPSGQGAGVLSSSGTDTSANPNKKQNFATLQSYLKTNKPQGEQFAGKLAEGVSQVGQQAQQGIDTTKQKLASDVQANTLNYDPNVVQEAVSNPTQFVQDPNKLKTFTDYRTASYGGPQSAESTTDFQKAQADTAAALERSKLVDTEGGRKQLAAEAQKSKAGGITALNQALLSTNPNAAATLQGAKVPFANLQSNLGASAEQINAQIKAAQEAAEQARTGVATGIEPLFPELEKGLKDRYEEELNNRNLFNERISKAKQDLQPLDTALRSYNQGNNPNYINPVTGKIEELGSTVVSSPTQESAATDEQYALESALEKLAGQPSQLLPDERIPAFQLPDISTLKPEQQEALKQDVTKNYLKPAVMDELRRILGNNHPDLANLEQLPFSNSLGYLTGFNRNGVLGQAAFSPEFTHLLEQLVPIGMIEKIPDPRRAGASIYRSKY